LMPFIAQLKPCLVEMEACGGAHHFAREIAKHGHDVKLMSPRFVRPYVKPNKNDAGDGEAVIRPSMRFRSGQECAATLRRTVREAA